MWSKKFCISFNLHTNLRSAEDSRDLEFRDPILVIHWSSYRTMILGWIGMREIARFSDAHVRTHTYVHTYSFNKEAKEETAPTLHGMLLALHCKCNILSWAP